MPRPPAQPSFSGPLRKTQRPMLIGVDPANQPETSNSYLIASHTRLTVDFDSPGGTKRCIWSRGSLERISWSSGEASGMVLAFGPFGQRGPCGRRVLS